MSSVSIFWFDHAAVHAFYLGVMRQHMDPPIAAADTKLRPPSAMHAISSSALAEVGVAGDRYQGGMQLQQVTNGRVLDQRAIRAAGNGNDRDACRDVGMNGETPAAGRDT